MESLFFSLGSCMQEIASTLQESFSVFPVLWNSYIKPFWHSGLMLESLTWSQIPRLDSLTGCQTFKSWGITSLHMLSWVKLLVTPWTDACQASLSITSSWSMLKLMSIESVMPSNHLILSCPSPPAFNLSQHQGLFMWVSSSHQVAKVLELQLQHQSVLSMNIQDWSPLGWTSWISLQSKALSRVFSNTTVQKHQFFGTQLSLWFNMTTGKTIALTRQTFVSKVMSLCCLGWSKLFFQGASVF